MPAPTPRAPVAPPPVAVAVVPPPRLGPVKPNLWVEWGLPTLFWITAVGLGIWLVPMFLGWVFGLIPWWLWVVAVIGFFVWLSGK